MMNEEKITGDQGEVFWVQVGCGVFAFVCNGFCRFLQLEKNGLNCHGRNSVFGEVWHAWAKKMTKGRMNNGTAGEHSTPNIQLSTSKKMGGQCVQNYFWVGQPLSKRPGYV